MLWYAVACPLPKDIYILISKTWYGNRIFANVIMLRILAWGDYPGEPYLQPHVSLQEGSRCDHKPKEAGSHQKKLEEAKNKLNGLFSPPEGGSPADPLILPHWYRFWASDL
jgi:hypothetical protein